jgi:hypothetical protein
VQAYHKGIYLALPSLAIAGRSLAQLTIFPAWHVPGGAASALHTCGSVAAAVLFATSLSLPRRPDVFFHGRLVDQRLTVSAWGAITYRWAGSLMSLAAKKGDLEMADFPRLGRRMRAADRSVAWDAGGAKDSPFVRLVKLYGWAVAKQWTLVIINTGLSYLPWWVTLQLLQSLETRMAGDPIEPRLWVLVAWLAVAKGVNAVSRLLSRRSLPLLTGHSAP